MRRVTLYPVEQLITGPTREPIDLDELKKVVQNDTDADDTILDRSISSARQWLESQTGLQLLTATRENWLPAFPSSSIELTRAPLQSVTSVKYLDDLGALQTIDAADYVVSTDAAERPTRGTVDLPVGGVWPTVCYRPGAVRVRFVCGFGDVPSAVPEILRDLLYQLIYAKYHALRCVGDARTTAPSWPPMGAEEVIREWKSDRHYQMETVAYRLWEPRPAGWL